MENNTNEPIQTTSANEPKTLANTSENLAEQSVEPMSADTKQIIKVSAITALITTIIIGVAFLGLAKDRPELLNGRGNQTVRTISENENAIVDAVKAANPAVVAITISKNVPTYEQYEQNFPGFFGGFQVPQVRQNGTELQEVGGGSGFLVSSNGFIVTNNHVVSDTEAQYTVFTNDGKKYEAKVVGRDPILDLAVIKVDGSGFTSLTFADSDKVQLGQTAIAIGNALGEFRNTVSSGIISGLARSITASDGMGGSENLDQLIQTDTSINSGNSGGPLLNLSGEVIGVNVAVANGANGIGFALSANSVKNVIESVKKNGRIIRAYLGVRYTPVNEALQKQNNLSVDYGALVVQGATVNDLAVIPGSPADKAGIQVNDIILEIDGNKIDGTTSLQSIVGKKNIGDKISIKLLSKGGEKTIEVTLEEAK